MGQATAKLLARLVAAHPREKITPVTIDVYVAELAEIPDPVLEVTVTRLIRTGEWFPTVNTIRQEAAELVLALPHEVEALTQVEKMVAWSHDPRQDRPPVHPLVKEAVDLVGGYREFRVSEDPGVVRGQFTRYYRELRADAIRAAKLAPALEPSRKREIAA